MYLSVLESFSQGLVLKCCFINAFLCALKIHSRTLREKIILQDLKLMLCSFRPDKLAKQGWASNWDWRVPVKDIHFAENCFDGLEHQCTLYR